MFLVLHKAEPKHAVWRPIAVSIILPLTRDGAAFLHEGAGGAADLDASHVVARGKAPAALLVDTWIVKAKGPALDRRGKKQRLTTDKFANSLTLLHVGILLPRRRRAEIIVEADNRQLAGLLDDIGFVRRSDNAGNDHRSVLPGDLSRNEKLRRIMANVENLRRWPIGNLRSGVDEQA